MACFSAFFVFPFVACFNFGLLYDNQHKVFVFERLNLVHAVFLVYEEGVFVYRRKLNKDEEDYSVQEEDTFFVAWDNVKLLSNSSGKKELYSDHFVKFYLGNNLILGRRDVYETLEKQKTEFILRSLV
eukprot:snap_masked-scaffold_56-processed-gene-0.33-mRNA-1 protein AED:1.00 eAED:1.00 QI:0/0/0/0/1/1/2/0/127